MSCGQDELVAIVLTEAENRQVPFTLQDIAAVFKVTDTKGLEDAIKSLCMIGMLTAIRDSWILTDYVPHQPDVHDDVRRAEGEHQLCTSQLSQEGLENSTLEPHRTSHLNVMPTTPVQVTKTSSASSVVSYDCEEESLEKIASKLNRIVQVIKQSTTPIKGHEIAKRCELGTSKSAVNRYLYLLERKGTLVNNDSKWSLQQEVQDTDLAIYAAELADKKPNKKQKAKAGRPSECEYGCEKPNGNCYHYKQENHYHQHITQVGDGSKVEFHSHGEHSVKK